MTDHSKELLTDVPTPLSTRMGWPLLSSRESNINLDSVSSTPFSDIFHLPMLSSSQSSSTELRTETPTPLSDRFGWALLSSRSSSVELKTDDPTPLSSMLNLPLLTDRSRVEPGQKLSDSDRATSGGAVAGFIRGVVSGEPPQKAAEPKKTAKQKKSSEAEA